MNRDLNQLQGVWSVSALKVDGRRMLPAMFENARVVIRKNRFTSTGMGTIYEGTLELDESAMPRQLTMRFDAGPEKGNTNLCIYELDGDTWKMCIATRGNKRPARFVSTAGSGLALETLTRGDAAVSAAAKPKKRIVKSDAPKTELEGTWQMISGIFDGAPMSDSETRWVKRLTEGNQTVVTAGDQVMMRFEFSSDTSQTPKHLDYVHVAGASKGKIQHGIYALAGERLTVCTAAPGKPRPSQLESSPGLTLTVWQRL